jgi:hypothetical protein
MFSIQIDWHCLCGDSAASHVSTAEGEECRGHCQKTDHDCLGWGYRPIAHVGRTPAISAIIAAAARNYWPRHYTCDLSTDYRALIDYDGPFIWVLRESGTHLYKLDWTRAEGPKEHDWQWGYVRSALQWLQANHPEAYVYSWSPLKGELARVDFETALAIAATRIGGQPEAAPTLP